MGGDTAATVLGADSKKYGKNIKNRSGEPKTKIQSARLQPLQTLRPAARLYS